MEKKRLNFIKNYDHIRQLLIEEPRGYPCQNLNILYPSAIENCVTGYMLVFFYPSDK